MKLKQVLTLTWNLPKLKHYKQAQNTRVRAHMHDKVTVWSSTKGDDVRTDNSETESIFLWAGTDDY